MADANPLPHIGPLPTRTKILYGFSSIAYGIKDNGFATFLLFYYNQVVGLRADLVSAAIALALIIDAFIDPLIGRWSDRTRTPIGRRHPFLYGSIVPVTVAWLLLWHPPEASEPWTFVYLLVFALAVRVSLSLNEVPGLALLPELTKDYADRTSTMRFRFLFGWGSGLSMMALVYGVLLVPTDQYPNGLLNRDGYSQMAIIGAVAMAIGIFIAAMGTQKRIVANYKAAGHLPPSSESLGELFRTFNFRPFLLLMLAGVFAFTNQGIVFALTPYLLTHIWLFDQGDLFIYAVSLFGAAVIAFLGVNSVAQRLGKKETAATMTIVSMLLGTAPYWLRAAGLFPDPSSPVMVPLLIGIVILSTAAGIAVMICTMSMMADVTDAYEYEASKKSEGVFSSGMWLMQKAVGGIGILVAGLIVSLVGIPEGAERGSVAMPIVDDFAITFASITVVVACLAAWAYTLFPLSQADHEDRLMKMHGPRPGIS